jgi:transposase
MTPGERTEVVAVHPAPEPAVLTAIVAAVEEVWPRPRAMESADHHGVSAWRFSGRWWSKPSALRRDRPRAGG